MLPAPALLRGGDLEQRRWHRDGASIAAFDINGSGGMCSRAGTGTVSFCSNFGCPPFSISKAAGSVAVVPSAARHPQLYRPAGTVPPAKVAAI